MEDLRRSYGVVEALRGVDLEVSAGEIVGLLGPNGAGKTTLVSIVAGLRKADGGRVTVGGRDALAHSRTVRHLIGLAPQDIGLYPVLSVRNNLRLFGELAGMPRRALATRMEEVAAALDLTDLLDRLAGTLSGGQKRRLHTALALLHRPRLLLLDEATVGADVETRQQLIALVRQLAADGAAVLYSTHYLHEVADLGATVAILDEGQVIARGPADELVAAHAETAVELLFDGPAPSMELPDGASRDGRLLRIPTDDPAQATVRVLANLPAQAPALRSIEVRRPSLEAVYLALTGKRYSIGDPPAREVAHVGR